MNVLRNEGINQRFILFNHATRAHLRFNQRLLDIGVVVMEEDKRRKKKEMFYLTMYSTHFIYGYMASVI